MFIQFVREDDQETILVNMNAVGVIEAKDESTLRLVPTDLNDTQLIVFGTMQDVINKLSQVYQRKVRAQQDACGK